MAGTAGIRKQTDAGLAKNSAETNAAFFGTNPAPPTSQSLYNPATQTYAPTPTYQQSGGGNTNASGMAPSLQSLGRASGSVSSGGQISYSGSGTGGYNDMEAERLRIAGRDEGITNREDVQAFQKELAGLNAGYSASATSSAQDFERQQAANKSAEGKANQDQMWSMVQKYLDKGVDHVAAPSDVDTTAAQDAAFARAKDRTAQLARSSLMALRASSAERGINVAGGTNPALLATEGKVLAGANQPLADLTREQAIQTTQRAQSVADRNYQGEITQAGQKAQLAPSLLSLMRMTY